MKHLRVIMVDGIYVFTGEEAEKNEEKLYYCLFNDVKMIHLETKEYGDLIINKNFIVSTEYREI